MPYEIVLVQALHDYDDGAVLLAVQTTVESVIEPLIGRAAAGLGQRFIGLERIIDYDEVRAAAG
jgi:hypothetical protein